MPDEREGSRFVIDRYDSMIRIKEKFRKVDAEKERRITEKRCTRFLDILYF